MAPSAPQFFPRGEVEVVLVLTRKVGERIYIGDRITVTVVKMVHGGVRLGIDAPPEMAVVREELARELARAEEAAAQKETSSASK